MMNSQQVDDIHQQFNWEDCYKTAQNVAFPDVGFICSSHVKRLVLGYCNSIGCPQEYIFLPLLTTCAGNIQLKNSFYCHTDFISLVIVSICT